MRIRFAVAVIAVHLTLPAGVAAQPLAGATPADSVAMESVVRLQQPWHAPSAAWDDESIRYSDAHVFEMTAQARRGRRAPFVGVGALVGAVGGSLYMLHASRDGALGYVGAIVTVPMGMMAGGFLGAAGGYVVSLVVYPPWRAD